MTKVTGVCGLSLDCGVIPGMMIVGGARAEPCKLAKTSDFLGTTSYLGSISMALDWDGSEEVARKVIGSRRAVFTCSSFLFDSGLNFVWSW